MATTTNYGWETPDDTDLVKDGASAIRTLGSSIDTTTKALNPETTLGDISYRSSTANTNTRLAIGTTGQVLTVSGGVPVWGAASGGLTLITSQDFSAVSSFSVNNCFTSTYRNYYLIFDYDQGSVAETFLRLRASGTDATASNYGMSHVGTDDATAINFSQTAALWPVGYYTGTYRRLAAMTLFGPQLAANTGAIWETHNSKPSIRITGGIHTVATSYDGFTVYTSTGNVTGNVRVYGLAN